MPKPATIHRRKDLDSLIGAKVIAIQYEPVDFGGYTENVECIVLHTKDGKVISVAAFRDPEQNGAGHLDTQVIPQPQPKANS